MGRRTRRAVLAALVAGAVWLAAAATVLADGGPHQADVNNGTTSLTADGCAGCHRVHTAEGAMLLAADESELCLVCHGSAAAGATTNVIDGVQAATTRGLRGGGFVNARMDTSGAGTAVSRPATSAHTHDGETEVTMWGNGAPNSGAGPTVTLTCGDCHNPHGNGYYRILNPIPNGSGAGVGVPVGDQAVPVYTVQSAQNQYFGEEYADAAFQTLTALDAWCAQCHTRHDATTANADETSSGDSIYTFRHTTRVVTGQIDCLECHDSFDGGDAHNPWGINGPAIAHQPLCQTCHVAHGSAAVMGTFSDNVAWPDGTLTPANDARSSLLRIDNRGLCVACHDPTD